MATVDPDIIDQLALQSGQGDRQAFSQLVRLSMNNIVALTYRLVQDRDTALDLAQETFITAWEKISQFRGESRFTSWLYRIATNKALNHLESESRRQIISSEAIDLISSEDSYSNSDSQLEKKELRLRVLSFMKSLPPQQRLVFELRFYKQQQFEEIAQITGKALGTVKTHYREAVNKLRQIATDEGWRQ